MGSDDLMKRSNRSFTKRLVPLIILLALVFLGTIVLLFTKFSSGGGSLRSNGEVEEENGDVQEEFSKKEEGGGSGIFAFSVPDNVDGEVKLSKYRGAKAILIVNTASQ